MLGVVGGSSETNTPLAPINDVTTSLHTAGGFIEHLVINENRHNVDAFDLSEQLLFV